MASTKRSDHLGVPEMGRVKKGRELQKEVSEA